MWVHENEMFLQALFFGSPGMPSGTDMETQRPAVLISPPLLSLFSTCTSTQQISGVK